MADTIKNSFVPFHGDGTAERIDQSLQDDLDLEWYRREKLAPKGESIPVIYGTVTVDGIDIFYKKYLYSKKRGNSWRGKWKELKEQVIAAQVFCYGGTYTIDEITYPSGASTKHEYDGTQTTPPALIYANRNAPKWGSYTWDSTSIGKGLVYAEYFGDHSRGHFANESIVATITRKDVANNHADVLVDYLTNTDYGVGWDVSMLDLPSFNDAKTYLTTIDPTTSETFLNCNFALDTSESFKKNLETLLGECRGALIESGGKIKLIIEQAVNPILAIDESIIVGAVQTESLDSAKRFNRVIAKYFDESGKAASMVVYPQTKSKHDEYLKEDNGVINQGELSLKTITNANQALTQARIMCELSRGGEALTVTVHGEATLLEVFDVVEVHYPDLDLIPVPDGSGGLKLPEYIVEEVHPDLEKQTAKIKLRFYNSAIYPIQDGRTDPPSPPRVPPISDVGTVTFTEVVPKDNNKLFIRWDYQGDYSPTYNVGIYRGSVEEDNLEYITSTDIEQITTPPMLGGSYIIELVLRDRLGLEILSATFSFSTDVPEAPAILNLTSTWDSITIEPTLPIGADVANTEFIYYAGVTDVEANAKNFGSGDVKQITGLKYDTTHHVWVYTRTAFGTSATPAYGSIKTQKIPQAIGGSRFEQRYKLSPPLTKPATPTGDDPVGWFTHPLPQSGNDINWTSTAEKNPDGTLVTGASWSEPVLFDAIGQYTWTAYADDPLGNGISLDATDKDWIGHAYNRIDETPDISDPDVYSWTIYESEREVSIYKVSALKPTIPTGNNPSGWSSKPLDPNSGTIWVSNGIKNLGGAVVGAWSEPEKFYPDQKFRYTWTAYADSPTGSGISLNPTGKKWIGQAYNREFEAPVISDPSVYTWTIYESEREVTIYKKQDTQPSTPTGNNPSGWSSKPLDVSSGTVWASSGTKDLGGQLVGTWSTPVKFTPDAKFKFTWTAYADNPDGTGNFSHTPKPSSEWIGQAFNKETETPSNNRNDYIWSAYFDGEPLDSVHIGTDSVTAPKIKANAVTAAKIHAGAVVADKIATNAVTAAKINANSVISDKIATNAVTAAKIHAGAVVADKIATNAVTADKIRANAVTSAKINANAVIAGKISAGAVNASNIIVDDAIVAEHLNATALDLRGSNVSIKMASGSSSTPVFQVNTSGHMITRSANIEGEVSIGKNPSASNYYKLYGQSTAGSASTAMRIRENNVNTFELMYDGQVVSRNSSGTVMMNLDPASGQFVFNGDVRADKVIGSRITRATGSISGTFAPNRSFFVATSYSNGTAWNDRRTYLSNVYPRSSNANLPVGNSTRWGIRSTVVHMTAWTGSPQGIKYVDCQVRTGGSVTSVTNVDYELFELI